MYFLFDCIKTSLGNNLFFLDHNVLLSLEAKDLSKQSLQSLFSHNFCPAQKAQPPLFPILFKYI